MGQDFLDIKYASLQYVYETRPIWNDIQHNDTNTCTKKFLIKLIRFEMTKVFTSLVLVSFQHDWFH